MKQPCPINNEHATSIFTSHNRVWCHDCKRYYDWPLKEGQKPLIGSNRVDRQEKPQ